MVLEASQLTPSGGDCPDIVAILQEMAEAVRTNQCNSQAQVKAYIDRLERVTNQRFAVLEGAENLTEILGQLQTLYRTLDVNDDGNLNDLVGFQNSLDQIVQRVAAIEGRLTPIENGIASTQQDLADYKTLANTTLGQHDTRLTNNEAAARNATETAAAAQSAASQANTRANTANATATQNTGLIEQLRTDLDGIASSETLEERAREVECAVYRRIDSAFGAFRQAIMVDCGHFPTVEESNAIAPASAAPAAPSGGDGAVL